MQFIIPQTKKQQPPNIDNEELQKIKDQVKEEIKEELREQMRKELGMEEVKEPKSLAKEKVKI